MPHNSTRRASLLPLDSDTHDVAHELDRKKLDVVNLRELREVFNLVDEDQSGYIDASELAQLFSILHVHVTDKQIGELLDDIAGKRDTSTFLTNASTGASTIPDAIHFRDFVRVLAYSESGATYNANKLKRQFKRVNDNAPAGLIHEKVLVKILTKKPVSDNKNSADEAEHAEEVLSEQEAAYLVSRLPKDQYGYVDYARYVDTMLP
jgi:Ca2+-binding EF-hand superfamily protein